MHIYRSWLFIIYVIFFHSVIGNSQGVDFIIAKADLLFNNGKYENALLDYQRAIYFSEGSSSCIYHTKIAQCYFSLGDLQSARDNYKKALISCCEDSLKAEIVLKSVHLDLGANNFYGAINTLNSNQFNAGSSQQKRIDFCRGISYWGLNDYDSAFDSFVNSLPDDDNEKRNELLNLRDESKTLLRSPSLIPTIMSGIIPGSGMVILGHFKDGLMSFLLCGGIGFLSVSSIFIFQNNIAFLYLDSWFIRYYLGGISHTSSISRRKQIAKQNEIFNKICDIASAEEFKDFFAINVAEESSRLLLNPKTSEWSFLDNIYALYKNLISPQDIMDCIYYPSCSAYALETVELNGFLGIFDTIDRLTRCHLFGHDSYKTHRGSNLYLNPVEKISK